MSDALKRIEEKHRCDTFVLRNPITLKDETHRQCARCSRGVSIEHPCDVVKLARAYVEAVKIAKWACECHNTPQGPDPENCDACRLQVEAKRTLEEVAE